VSDYIKITNDQPEIYTIGQLRRDNPNTSFPRHVPTDTLASYGVYPYVTEDQPGYTPATQTLEPGDFTQTESGWVRGWTVCDMTEAEIADRLHEKRAAMRITRGQFAIRAASTGLITPTEAEAWAGGTSLPAQVTDAFADSIADDMERLAARVDALTAPHIHRVNPLILLLQAHLGLTDDQADALFSYP
jgi:hypothetical protein